MKRTTGDSSSRPLNTALESTPRSWLALLLLAASILFLGGLALKQVSELLARGGIFTPAREHLLVIINLALTCMLMLLFFRTLLNMLRSIQLDESPYQTTAEVIDKWEEHSSDSQDFWIAYRYLDQNTAKARLRGDDYRRVRVGDGLKIRYLADRPAISRVDLEDLRSKPERFTLDPGPSPLDRSRMFDDQDD